MLQYFYQFQPDLLFSALFNIGFHQENDLDQALRFTALNIITLLLSVRKSSQFQSIQETSSKFDSNLKNGIAQYLFEGIKSQAHSIKSISAFIFTNITNIDPEYWFQTYTSHI
jgi:hypothetical protein